MSVPRLLSVAQVAKALQCRASMVRRLVTNNLLRATRIGARSIRIAEPDLQTYLDQRANIPAAVSSVPLQQRGTTK
jgi:excisionase family DNA binding protein